MNDLLAYRDDGPLASLLHRKPDSGPGSLGWLVPPMLRLLEYGTLLLLALLAEPAGPAALPACFALVAVLAYNHYNATYRLRHQGAAPPRWLRLAGGGWEVRLLAAFALFAAGWLAVGMYIAAATLAVLYAAETVVSWRRFGQSQRPVAYEEEDDEAE